MSESISEGYVDARQLAAIMGISVRTVRRMTRDGMPSETWGMSRCRRYLPSAAIAWAQGCSGGTMPRNDNEPGGVRQHYDGQDHARHRNG
jgi:hypothetical protein